MASDVAVSSSLVDSQQQILKNLARPTARSLSLYNAGLSAEAVRQQYGLSHIAKLASNENPLGASPQVVVALEADARFSAIYSDASSAVLRDALAGLTNLGYSEQEADEALRSVLKAEPDLDMGTAENIIDIDLQPGKMAVLRDAVLAELFLVE